MQQMKKPKKPLIFYYCIGLLIMFVLNAVVFPQYIRGQIEEVDYGTLLTRLEEKNVSMAQMEKDYIYFADNNEEEPSYYSTVAFNDPELVDRLKASGCKFGKVKEKIGRAHV